MSCTAPHLQFEFPNGAGTAQQDERVTVELPKGFIDLEGIAAITALIGNHRYRDGYLVIQKVHVPSVLVTVGYEWQGKRGNFTKRLSSTLYDHGIKLEDGLISQVGNIASEHSVKTSTWDIEFTRDLNRPSSYFYNNGSCWWSSGDCNDSRCSLKNWGGLAMRSFDAGISDLLPAGRAWVQPLNEALRPTHDALNASAFLVYNGYGTIQGYIGARIIAHLTSKTYKKILFTCHQQWINGNSFLIASEALCERTIEITLQYDKHAPFDADTLRSAA